jgi:hypothetical protein
MPTKAIKTETIMGIWFEIKDPLEALKKETWDGEGCPYGADVDGIYEIRAKKQFSSSAEESQFSVHFRDPIDHKNFFMQHNNYYVETRIFTTDNKYAPGYGPTEIIKYEPIRIGLTEDKFFSFYIKHSFLENIHIKDGHSLCIQFDFKIYEEFIKWEYKMREYYTENFLKHVRRLDRRIDELEEKLKQK